MKSLRVSWKGALGRGPGDRGGGMSCVDVSPGYVSSGLAMLLAV